MELVTPPGTPGPLRWLSDDSPPHGGRIGTIGDRTVADEAVRRLRHEWLFYRGNYKNARQLLAAVDRRLQRRRENAKTLLERFRAERQGRQLQHEALSHLLVGLDASWRLDLAAAPDVASACRWRWPPAVGGALVPLRQLQGVLGAYEWYRKGLVVAGLHAPLHPHFGVFTPTRGVYPELLQAVPDPAGKVVFDIGTGTGVLSFLLLERRATRVVATDIDANAVASAREDAQRLGFASRFEVREANLFPEGRADIVVCNPPWLPEAVRGRFDTAVFDPESRFLRGFLSELPAHLAPNGVGCLLISNLAVLLGLRSQGFLAEAIERAGLRVTWQREAPASHPRSKDRKDRLHEARAQEVVTLYGLMAT